MNANVWKNPEQEIVSTFGDIIESGAERRCASGMLESGTKSGAIIYLHDSVQNSMIPSMS